MRASSDRSIKILLFIILFLSFVYFLPRWADWGANSRLNLALAIVEQGTLVIDDYYQNTGDYAYFEGHYYLDKAPGPSFLAVPVYGVVYPILNLAPVQNLMTRVAASGAFSSTLNEEGTGLLPDKIYDFLVLYWVTVVVVSIPSAFLGVILFSFLRDLGLERGWSAVVVLIYAWATNAFAYASSFNSHQLTAFLLFGAFYLGYLMRQERLSWWWIIAAGFMLGYAVICEYPTALIALAVFIYIAVSMPNWRWMIALILSGLPPGLLLMAYNWTVFHTPLPVGYKYSELYTDLHSVGLFSITYPHPEALFGLTFGSYRGLFFVSPVLLVALWGLVVWWKSWEHRKEWAVCVWSVLTLYLFYGSSAMWQGGYAVGPRYLVPMLPFLVMGFQSFLKKWGKSRWVYYLVPVLAVISFLVVWAETIGSQSFPDWTINPLFNYSLPALVRNDIARNVGMALGLDGWASLIPLLGIELLLVFFLFRMVNKARADHLGETDRRVDAVTG